MIACVDGRQRTEELISGTTMATVDPSYQLLACQYVRGQLDALARQMRGVRQNKDIEPVHKARVASRRLRVALRMFAECFNAKTLAQWRRRIKKLTKGLGAARDLDVQIDFVERCLEGLDQGNAQARPGVERLLLRLRQRRDAAQPEVLEAVEALEKGKVLANMHGELERTLFVLRSRDVQVRSPFVFERAAAHVRRRRQDLWTHERALADPQDVVGHHQMRIAAKKLRYTMEIYGRVYGKRLEPVIKAVKDLQSLLGDIHDCDVWVEYIETFIDQERLAAIDYFGHPRPFESLKPGLLLIHDERKAHREQSFAELLGYWKQLERENLWEDLEDLLRSQGNAPSPETEQRHPPVDAREN
jgi:CHAD domain-containing protein